jgi:hypothetical protein
MHDIQLSNSFNLSRTFIVLWSVATRRLLRSSPSYQLMASA